MRTAISSSTEALLASFEVSYLIAKNKKPPTIRKTTLLPLGMKMCGIYMVKYIYGETHKTVFFLIVQWCEVLNLCQKT
jgi:hypothetical protein